MQPIPFQNYLNGPDHHSKVGLTHNEVGADLIRNFLPIELIHKLLDELDKQSLYSATCLDRFWKEATLSAVEHRGFLEVKNFAKFLYEKLNEKCYKSQKEKLSNLGKDKKTSDFHSLKQIETAIQELKKEILIILEELDDQDLDDLERVSTTLPKVFENIFKLAKNRKKIEREWKCPYDTGPVTCYF